MEAKETELIIKDLNKEKVSLVIPPNYELYVEDGKYVLVRKELPKTWQECVLLHNKTGKFEYIDLYSNVVPFNLQGNAVPASCNNLLPEGYGEAMIALSKLLVCRDTYRNGWTPEINNGGVCYNVVWDNAKEEFYILDLHHNYTICFQSEEVANAFLINFEELLRQAKDLIY